MSKGVALTGHNRTGPPRSVGRPTAHARRPAGPLARRQRYRRRQTTPTDDTHQRAKQYWPIRRASNKRHPVYCIQDNANHVDRGQVNNAHCQQYATEVLQFCGPDNDAFPVGGGIHSKPEMIQDVSWQCGCTA